MPVSPEAKTDGPVRVTISCEGDDQDDLPLISVTVRHALNAVSWARLVIADGDMPESKVTLSDGTQFKLVLPYIIHSDDGKKVQ